jgi:hypothetical protein
MGDWAALDKATGRRIGRMGLDELEDWPDAHKIEVDWELYRAWWGKGVAIEAWLATLQFGFGEHWWSASSVSQLPGIVLTNHLYCSLLLWYSAKRWNIAVFFVASSRQSGSVHSRK